ncbi:hemolysin C [Thalassobaculum fulvum]|uniref:Hemolysin C n=1 Tax=Thalassobaculum fulvum TaxID=1633335 RepID=A0A919CME8_9PROT|nr:hemolysin family protein [Thalassobaculum fulvum]GHD39977.1 hemolysin C [Thalassobaculum fulvum]
MSDNGSSGSSSSAVGQDRGALSDAWRTLLRAVGLGRNGTSAVRASLEELIEENEDDSPIDPHEGAIIRNVLGLRDITAYDVMVPRADIVAVEQSLMLSEAAKVMGDAAHSRMPIYRGTLDDVIGMIHLKDVVRHLNRGEDVPVSELAREVTFVAPSSRALDLLQEMRMTRRHLALVVDEYGGIDGLITIEDLVEEIVGEISDEHDVDEAPKLEEKPDGTILADARATVEEFEALVGPVLTEDEREEIDTLGGLVFSLAGRVATRGEVIRHPAGLDFEVVAADPRRLRTLRVRRRPNAVDRAAE